MSKNMLKSHLKGEDVASNTPLWRKILLICIWLFWMSLLGLMLLVGYGWTQRYDILEDQARRFLAENNIEADLDIIFITRNKLRVDGITMRDQMDVGAPPFFTADNIEAEYEWRDLLRGKVKSLSFTRPQAVMDIDASGKLISGWVPPSQGENKSKMVFPEDGIAFKDGQLTLRTPYGELISAVDATVHGAAQFDAALDIAPAALRHEGHTLTIGGAVTVTANDNVYAVKPDMQLSNISTPSLSAAAGQLKGDWALKKQKSAWNMSGPLSLDMTQVAAPSANIGALRVSTDTINISQNQERVQASGPINLRITDVSSESLAVKALALTSKGEVTVDSASSGESVWARSGYVGDVDIEADGVALTDTALRGKLAQALSLSGVLSKSPILSDFSPDLTAQTEQLLQKTDISAIVSVVKTRDDLTLTAREALRFTGDKPWSVKPRIDAPLLNIKAGIGTASFDFEKLAPLPLALKGAQLGFAMSAPAKFEGVTDFSGRLIQTRPWQGVSEGGKPVQLAAEPSDVSFKNMGDQSRFSAKTTFAITGELPGGYVTGLKGAGKVQILTKDARSRLEFTPHDELSFDRLDLSSGWILEDANLKFGAPFVMEGPPTRRAADISLQQVNMRVHDGAERSFVTQAAMVTGQGLLTQNGGKLTQVWDMTLTDGRMTSPVFPLEDTDIFSPHAVVKISMTEGSPPVFDIDSPQTKVSSSLVSTDEIAVHIAGTPENLVVDYDAKLFRFADPSLPEIPMAGQTRLMNARWTGESVAWLPEDLTTPIDISFEFENGVGSADIDIKALQFTPRGLQPQSLVSNLRGKLAEVDGLVSASIKLGFGEGVPLTSSGRAEVENMNLAISAGPIEGLNTSLEFSSFFPLKTSGRQTIKLAGFDPGFPLPAGEIEFELLPGKMKIHSAEWPMAGGRIYIDPLVWDFEADENYAVLVIDKVAIQDMLDAREDSKFEITGAVSGRLPVTISGVNVIVDGGKLSVPGGGVIRFTHEGTDLAGAQNQAAGVAFDALKDFQYKTLEADINGPLDGVIRLQTIFSGYNDKVFEGQPFEFDLELEGELMNLMRELNPETQKNRALSGDIVDLLLKN